MKQSSTIDKEGVLSNIEQKSYFVSNEFVLKDSIDLPLKNDHLMAAIINNLNETFVLIDFNGIITWKWKNQINKNKREVFYDSKESVKIIDIIFNPIHKCYFSLYSDNCIGILNSKFQEVFRKSNGSGAILCLIFNSKNEELIASTVEGFKIFCIKIDEKKRWKSLMDLSNHELILKYYRRLFKNNFNELCLTRKEFKISDEWIKKMEIDEINCHLYCCSSHDLHIFDFNWTLIRHFKNIHSLPITCVIYSATNKCFITGSMDNTIKIWSITGDCIDILKSHSKSIVKLLVNPYNSDYFLSGSLDGTIKMWSLNVNQVVYEDNIINMKIDFFSNKNNQILAIGQEKSIRIFDALKATEVSTILPLPIDQEKIETKSIAYGRNIKYVFILLNEEIWIFYVRTYPSSKVCVWNTDLIQKNSSLENEELIDDASNKLSKKISYMEMQNLIRNHQAIDFSLLSKRQNEISKCRSIAYLESNIIFWNLEGQCTSLTDNFLLLGLENGSIIFCDPLKRNKKYAILKCSKDPVVEIIHDKINNYLITKIELKELFQIQYWTLPDLKYVEKVYFSKMMTAFNRINENVLVGFEDGSLDISRIISLSKHCSDKPLSEVETKNFLKKSDKYEHKQKVEMIDVCHCFNFFLSFSKDGQIKIWNKIKKLIVEINLDSSLSACCFLNNSGDIITSWKNHLFKISLDKIIPDIRFLAKEENFINDSEIFNTEYNFEDENESIFNMNKYLNPFNLKLNVDGKIEYGELKKNKKKIEKSMHGRIEALSAEENFSDESNSLTNQSSFSFLSSPRIDSNDNLYNIDLMLDSELKKKEIHDYLVHLFTKSKKNEKKLSFPKEWKTFPKVGSSPSRTPELSSTDTSPRDYENENDEIKKDQPEKSLCVEEGLSTKLKKKKNETGDSLSKNLPNLEVKGSKNSNDDTNKQSTQIKINNLYSNEKNNKETIILPLSTGKFSRSALPLPNSTKDSNCKGRNIDKLEKKEKSNRNKRYAKKADKISENKFSNQSIKPINKPTKPLATESSYFDSISNKTETIDFKDLNMESGKNKISLKNEIRNLNKNLQKIHSNKKKDLSSLSYFDINSENRTEFIHDLNEQKKTKELFSYIFLKSSIPKRISAGIYHFDKSEEINSEDNFNYESYLNERSDSECDYKSYDEINIPYFKDWIKNYKSKKNNLNLRMNQAKLRRENFNSKRNEKILNSLHREKLKDLSGNFDNYDSSTDHVQSNKKINRVNLKSPYFISQLEMEEILKEVDDNLLIHQNSYSKNQITNKYKGGKIISERKNNFEKKKTSHLIQNSSSSNRFGFQGKDKFKSTNSFASLQKSTSSIPAKEIFNNEKDYPEIKIHLYYPGSPEKYLLPVRFPRLYHKLINKLKNFE